MVRFMEYGTKMLQPYSKQKLWFLPHRRLIIAAWTIYELQEMCEQLLKRVIHQYEQNCFNDYVNISKKSPSNFVPMG